MSNIPDVDKSNWHEDHIVLIIGNVIGFHNIKNMQISVIPFAVFILVGLLLGFWRKRRVLLNLPKAGSNNSAVTRRYPPELDYHTGHIVPVRRTAPPVPRSNTPNAPPLPPAYNDIIDTREAENGKPL